jgi:hypothetical protein
LDKYLKSTELYIQFKFLVIVLSYFLAKCYLYDDTNMPAGDMNKKIELQGFK